MTVDMHTHPFGALSHRDLYDKIRTVPDLVGFRTKYPELYQARLTEEFVDFGDELVKDMDRNGIRKSIVQPTGGRGSNELVADAVKKHPTRLVGFFRIGHDQEAAGYVDDPEPIRKAAPDQIAHCVEKLGLKGMGEMMVRAFTTELHPERIARDLRGVMEACADFRIPIMIPTGWSQFPGHLYFSDPTYVDEIAGRHPDVPIVLTKMGRGIEPYFESALAVAMRNANVYFDTVTTTAAHLRRAVDTIGASRIMFGTDWSPTWRCVREPADLYTLRLKPVREAGLSEDDAQQILSRTAADLFRI